MIKGKGYRGKIIALYKSIIVDMRIDLNEYPKFQDNSSAWYQKHQMVAHGLGEIEGYATTNTKEAFEKAYQNGYRVFETDISKTIDGKFVLSHDFEGLESMPTYELFLESKIKEKYTPLSLEWIADTLVQYPDIYIMTDIKEGKFGEILRQIVVQAAGNLQILDRVIVQVYSPKDIKATREVHDFENILYSTYKSGYTTQKEIAKICLEHNIPVVTQGAMKNTVKEIAYFKEKNIKTFAFTVNDKEYAKELLQIGYDGIYSDTLTQKEMTE